MAIERSYAAYTRLKFDRPHAAVLRITLDNGKMNSADSVMHGELARIWSDLDSDGSVNSVIITGAGSNFSSGGDFSLVEELHNDHDARARGWREARDIVYGVINCSKPVVSAMRGSWMMLMVKYIRPGLGSLYQALPV